MRYDNKFIRSGKLLDMHIAMIIASMLYLTSSGKALEIHSLPLYKLRNNLRRPALASNLLTQLPTSMLQKKCYVNHVLTECLLVYPTDITNNYIRNVRNFQNEVEEHQHLGNSSFETQTILKSSPLKGMINRKHAPTLNTFTLLGKLDGYASQKISNSNSGKLNLKLDSSIQDKPTHYEVATERNPTSALITISTNSLSEDDFNLISTTNITQNESLDVTAESADFPSSTDVTSTNCAPISEKKSDSLDSFERKFYATTFSKLTSISPVSRRENGMSYVQSGLFLQLALIALSTEVGPEARQEIDECLELHVSNQEKVAIINATVSSLPVSSEDLKFRWSTRLVLQSQNVSNRFRTTAAAALRLHIDTFNGSETPTEMAQKLNRMVELDSGGAIHNTFEEDEMSESVRAILITTLYLRARWRSAPTLLNGTHLFHDSENAPHRSARMIKVNDIMRYADLTEWDAEALEIFYSTAGLSLLMLVPRGNSLRRLADEAVKTSLRDITERMQPLRIAATLPLYTLRMTLLLPNKLEAMNISRLVDTSNGPQSDFRLSLAIQRIMFWAEAGRNAFKDDGLDWDEKPQREIIVDRPYIFYVRWKNKTLMNGNFVF